MQLNNCLQLFITISFLCSAAVVDSFKFLAVLNTALKSHFIVGEGLMKGLAAKGHQVYVISGFPQRYPIQNYYDIPVDIEYDEDDVLFDETDDNFFTAILNFYRKGIFLSDNVLKHQNVQRLLTTNQTFDAVICEIYLAESVFGLSEHFKAPLIGLSTLGASTPDTEMVGSPSPPSYVPYIMLGISDHMTLFQRVLNVAVLTVEKIIIDLYYLPAQAAVYEKYFPKAARDMYTVRKNAAAVLLNTHVSIDYPRPYMPNHIEVGGLHIEHEPKSLHKFVRKFIQEAEHGVVYFSIGSNLRSMDMPPSVIQKFLAAFARIKQRVLWKFESPVLPGKPENVLIRSWFPQNEILDEENVKVFITHSGLLSITESIYHGKPIIGIPMVGDQYINIMKAVKAGFAVQLDFQTLTTRDIIKAINLIIEDKSYNQRAKEMSKRYRDQPLPPRDLAVFWVEHIARHKGAKYLHCAGLDLNFIQYHNIDIGLIIFLTIFVHLCLIYRFFMRRCRPAPKMRRRSAVRMKRD